MSAFPPESPDPQIFRPAQKDDSGRPRRQRKPKNVTRQLLRRPLNDHLGCGIAAGMRHRSQPTGCGSCRAHRVPQEAIPVANGLLPQTGVSAILTPLQHSADTSFTPGITRTEKPCPAGAQPGIRQPTELLRALPLSQHPTNPPTLRSQSERCRESRAPRTLRATRATSPASAPSRAAHPWALPQRAWPCQHPRRLSTASWTKTKGPAGLGHRADVTTNLGCVQRAGPG